MVRPGSGREDDGVRRCRRRHRHGRRRRRRARSGCTGPPGRSPTSPLSAIRAIPATADVAASIMRSPPPESSPHIVTASTPRGGERTGGLHARSQRRPPRRGHRPRSCPPRGRSRKLVASWVVLAARVASVATVPLGLAGRLRPPGWLPRPRRAKQLPNSLQLASFRNGSPSLHTREVGGSKPPVPIRKVL